MSEKFDIKKLREAVHTKLISLEAPMPAGEVDIFQGSHSPHDLEDEDFDYEDEFDDDHNFSHDHYEEHKGGEESDMVKQNLFQLSVYAAKLHDLVEEGCDIEEWVQEKIVEATSKISDVYHHLEYEKFKESR